jgi:O-antigen/teichoic acid export membrane protein
MVLIDKFISGKSNKIKLQKSILNLLRLYSVPVISFLVSYCFISWYSISVWGVVCKYYLWINILCSITNFGSAGFLVRQFSFEPNKISNNLLNSLLARLPIVVLIIFVLLFFHISLHLKLIFICIVILKTLQQTIETVIHFERKYFTIFYSEIVANTILILSFIAFRNNVHQMAFIFFGYLLFELTKTIFYFFSSNINLKNIVGSIFDYKILKGYLPFFFLSIVGLLYLKFDQLFATLNFTNIQIGNYQLISTMQVLSVTFFGAISQPYFRNIYRIKTHVFKNIFRKMFLFILPFSVLFSVLIFLILYYFFNLQLQLYFIIVIAVNIVLLSANNLLNIGLLRIKKERLILLINILSIAIITVFALFVFPNLIELGLLLSLSFSQIIIFFVQLFLNFGKK